MCLICLFAAESRIQTLPIKQRVTHGLEKHTTSAFRIDFFLVSAAVSNNTSNVQITSSLKSDHSLISLSVQDNTLIRGPGVWKFNDQLLKDPDFITSMTEHIEMVIHQVGNTNLCPITIWEHIKMQCKKFVLKRTKNKSKDKNQLLNNLHRLHQTLKNENLAQQCHNKEAILQVAEKIQEIENQQLQSSIYRSRSKWAKEGCKMSKYFFSLEKRNFANKTMFTVMLENGQECKQQKLILNEQKHFYERLYTSDPEVNFTITNDTNIRLTNEQKQWLENDITLDEIYTTLCSMDKDKVPGCDGLTNSFFLQFWDVLKNPLWNMYQKVLQTGCFGPSSRKGLLSLIPKCNKDTRYIKNLRPLTLLSTDYKLLAKTMATRMKNFLPFIISDSQTGFMEGRSIHDNLRTTIDIISHIYQSGKKACIVSIDFEKCFDRIEHESIYAALRYFNFGENFVAWSKIFFTEFQLFMQNAGFLSDLFIKACGVNQGCNYSLFCFNICSEIMSHLIKNNPYIKGVKVAKGAVERVITQFADNTALSLVYEESRVNAALATLTCIESNTGLKVSYEKTCIYRIGSLRNSDSKLYTIKPIQWSDGDINMLGVNIKNDLCQNNSIYDSVLDQMDSISKKWFNRTLTLTGKILLINALMSSLFVYKMYVFPTLSGQQIERFYNIISTFLWKGKKAKIPLKVLQNSKSSGGLNLVNVKNQQISIQLSWINKVNNDPNWYYINEILCPELKEKIWQCNLNAKHTNLLNMPNQFWTTIVDNWFNLYHHYPQNFDEVIEQTIW